MSSLPVSVASGLLEWLKGGLSLLSFAFMCHWKKVNLLLLSAVATEPLLVFNRVNYHPIFKCRNVPNPRFGCATVETPSRRLSRTSAGVPPSSHCRGAPGGRPLPAALTPTWRAAALRRALEHGHKNPADPRPLTEC